jgi:hypothetical protein
LKEFALMDNVRVGDISGVITALMQRMEGYELAEVSYVHNGDFKTAWVELWRLEKIE